MNKKYIDSQEKMFEKYEKDCKSIRKSNEKLLNKFHDYLDEKGLTQKTIKEHVSNIDFYINEYLLYYDANLPQEGIFKIDGFLGDWFPRKALWSSVTSVKNYIASFKKFYSWMVDQGLNTMEELKEMKEEIKEEKDEWITGIQCDEVDSDFL
jgi:site-specific recombinase XerD